MYEADASTAEHRAPTMRRRDLVRRLLATSAVAWAAPEILATERASAMALSGCYTDYDFDDGSLQGWLVNSSGPARWRISSLHSSSGLYSVWCGRPNTSNSLHPVVGQPSYWHRNRPSSSTLTSPATTASASDVVCFRLRMAIENAVQYDVFRFFIVQGATRVQLWDKHQAGAQVIDHPEDPSSSWDLYTTFGEWVEITVPIGTPPGIDLASPVQFEFDFQTVDHLRQRTEGIYLDNIMLPCAPALSASSTGTGGSTSSLTAPIESGYQPGYQPPPQLRPPSTPREAPPS